MNSPKEWAAAIVAAFEDRGREVLAVEVSAEIHADAPSTFVVRYLNPDGSVGAVTGVMNEDRDPVALGEALAAQAGSGGRAGVS